MTDICPAPVADPPAPRAAGVVDASRSRAAISNGSRVHLLPVGDTVLARRYRDLLDGYAAQFGAIEEGDLSLCRSAARLQVTLEQFDAEMVAGGAIDRALAARITGRHRSLLRDLAGSQRHRRRRGTP